jgi:hypothetical protein
LDTVIVTDITIASFTVAIAPTATPSTTIAIGATELRRLRTLV